MGWHNSEFSQRAAISVDNTAGAAAGDINVTIPASWDAFWAVADTDGEEIRVTSSDGITLLAYSVDDGSGGQFDATNKLGRIQIDGATLPPVVDSVVCFWVYFAPNTPQGAADVATTITSPLSGFIELANPRTPLRYEPPDPSATRPRSTLSKTVTENLYVWLSVGHILARRITPGNGSQRHEELVYVVAVVLDDAGADASMASPDQTRFVWFGNDVYIRMQIIDGTDGDNYTIAPTVVTIYPAPSSIDGQRIEPRIGLVVRDLLLPA